MQPHMPYAICQYRTLHSELVSVPDIAPTLDSERHTLCQYRTPRSRRVAAYAMPVPHIAERCISTGHRVADAWRHTRYARTRHSVAAYGMRAPDTA
eukprot:664848-Rhodomonas_salina.1